MLILYNKFVYFYRSAGILFHSFTGLIPGTVYNLSIFLMSGTSIIDKSEKTAITSMQLKINQLLAPCVHKVLKFMKCFQNCLLLTILLEFFQKLLYCVGREWFGSDSHYIKFARGGIFQKQLQKLKCMELAAASDKVYQLLAHGWWFSAGTPSSSTTKAGRHDIAEILLKVALNNKNQSINH